MEYLSNPMALILSLALLAVVAVSTASDLAEHRIPNALLLPALLVALGLHLIAGGMPAAIHSLGGFVVGFAFLLPLYLMGGMGAGDVKLLAVAGAFLGPWGALIAGIVTLIAGGVLALLLVAWQLGRRFVAHLQATDIRSGTPLTDADPRRGDAPAATVRGTGFAYAPAIAVGVVFAMWQQGLLMALVPTG